MIARTQWAAVSFTQLRTVFAALAFLALSCPAVAQSISLMDVDASAFPNLRAKFFALDADGKQTNEWSAADLKVVEDGVSRTVTSVTNPTPSLPERISSVLTFDMSGSMSGDGLKIAKAAATSWIDAMPLGRSQCAITTFDTRSLVNQEFTADRTKLEKAIATMSVGEGTDYQQALLAPPAGALQMTKRGMHKKIIVMLADGLPDILPDVAAIVAEAQRQNATIFVVMLDTHAPEVLRQICNSTGGLCFENIATVFEAVAIYHSILQTMQGAPPYEVAWTSDGCSVDRSLQLQIPEIGVSTQRKFRVDSALLPRLEFTTLSTLHFGAVPTGNVDKRTIKVKAPFTSMRIEGLNVSHPWFRISDYGGGAPPFTLGTGEVRTITVEYAPQDSAYAACFIELTGNACDGNRFYADGGSSTALPPNITLRVMNPNGGEHLLAGDTVVITWEGVLPEEKIKLEYSTDAGSTWMFLTQATGLRYTWRIGKQPGGQCLLRATARSQPTFIEGMALIPPGSFLMGNTTGNAEGLSDEEPVHQVTLTRPFLMSRTEVTQAQYETVMGNNPSSFIGDDLPVEGTTWYDAVAFCNRLSKLESRDTCYTGSGESIDCDFTAKGYRLPTEAEWEYACRGGEETDFYTGNMTQPEYSPLDPALDRAGWYGGNSNGQYQPVGLKESNSFGLYDMHGNVMEWCWDRYAGYASGPSTDPRGPDVGGSRVHRGSGWWTGASPCRSARRGSGAPDWISVYKLSGFRIVRTY